MQAQLNNFALLTDLYEFTMAEAYYQSKMFASATFSLFIRDYPPNRGYFVSAGLEDVLDYLTRIRYSQEDLDYLKSTGLFSDDFLHYLSRLRFSGDFRPGQQIKRCAPGQRGYDQDEQSGERNLQKGKPG